MVRIKKREGLVAEKIMLCFLIQLCEISLSLSVTYSYYTFKELFSENISTDMILQVQRADEKRKQPRKRYFTVRMYLHCWNEWLKPAVSSQQPCFIVYMQICKVNFTVLAMKVKLH